MKHLAFMSYKANDLVHSALEEYLMHFDPRNGEALGLYDEAAELGIPHAQENSMYLYKLLQETECVPEKLPAGVGVEECSNYYEMMRMRRLVQLANNGDVAAKREIAFGLLERNEEESELERAEELSCSNTCKNTSSNTSSKSKNKNKGNNKGMNNSKGMSKVQEAAELLVLASEQGDIESLFSLGWMFTRGDAPFRNRSISRLVFKAAEDWEKQYQGQEQAMFEQGYTAYSTFGLAPYLAELYLRVDEWLEDSGFRSVEAVVRVWKYFLRAIYHDILSYFYVGEHKCAALSHPSLSVIYGKWAKDNANISLAIMWNAVAILVVLLAFTYFRQGKKRRELRTERDH